MNAIVAFSGGQDSTTCLAYAVKEYDQVAAVSFDYGQRHRVELEQARRICGQLDVPRVVLPLDLLAALGDAALTNAGITVEARAGAESGNRWARERGLPSTFVPGRNLLFFAAAAAYGLPNGFDALVTGVCEADDAGYPDCRASFVEAAQAAVRLAMDAPAFTIDAPLLSRSKAETWRWAQELGALDLVIEESHTCYQGDRSKRWPWGYGCGACPACAERRRGYEAAFPE